MGFDVSYHPINEDEMQHWYFDALEDQNIISSLAEKFDIHPFYQERYKEYLQKIKNEPSEVFDSSHGFNIAVSQGFVRKYFYTRGSAFSFLLDAYPEFEKYTKKWQDVFKSEFNGVIHNRILENYSSGVFIPNGKVKELLNDYENNENIRNILDEHYSQKRISVFLSALNFAKENRLGILEATDVIIPEPLDLNNSTCYSNLFNCDISGALLYKEAALEQIEKAFKDVNENSTSQVDMDNVKFAHITTINVADTEIKKHSFWQKIKNFFSK